MVRSSALSAAAVCALLSLVIPDGFAVVSTADKLDLTVLYVGNVDTSRHQDFKRFLERRFRQVKFAARVGFDPATAKDADVVLLDWSQKDQPFSEAMKAPSPLGPRDEWSTPTVLLGSAGLLISRPWQISGGYG